MYLLMKQKRFSTEQDFDVFDASGANVYRVEQQPMMYGSYLTIYDSRSGQELAVLKDVEARIYEVEMGLFIEDQQILGVKQPRLGYHVSVPMEIIGNDWRFDNRDDGYRYHIVKDEGEELVHVRREYKVTHSGYEVFIEDETIDPVKVLGIVLAEKMINESTKEEE